MIPKYLNCKSKEITNCDFYMHNDCPDTCNYALRLKKGIKHNAKIGLERFLSRFPNWKFHSQQRGVTHRTERVSSQSNLDGTNRPADNLYLGIGAMTEVPKGMGR